MEASAQAPTITYLTLFVFSKWMNARRSLDSGRIWVLGHDQVKQQLQFFISGQHAAIVVVGGAFDGATARKLVRAQLETAAPTITSDKRDARKFSVCTSQPSWSVFQRLKKKTPGPFLFPSSRHNQ
jgi:hypothetical protein